MFTTKYRPKTIAEFVGNPTAVSLLTQYLSSFDPHAKTRGILVHGPNGVGKSLLVSLVLEQLHCHPTVVSLEEERMDLTDLLHTPCNLFGRHNVVVIEDIDSTSNLVPNLAQYLRDTEIPIVCICDNKYHSSLKTIVPLCHEVKLMFPSFQEVYPLLYKVVTGENLRIGKKSVDALYEASRGDIRFMLVYLQSLSKKDVCPVGKKDLHSANIFDSASKLFSLEASLEEKSIYYSMDAELSTQFIRENYPGLVRGSSISKEEELKRAQYLSASADSLSDTDLLLEPYSGSAALCATTYCSKRSNQSIQFPRSFGYFHRNKTAPNLLSLPSVDPFLQNRTSTEKKGKTRGTNSSTSSQNQGTKTTTNKRGRKK